MVLISLCHVFGLCHSFKDCAMSPSLLFQEHYPNTLCKELTHLRRPWCWERLKAGGEGDDRGWEGWMASPTQWTWVVLTQGIGDGQGGLVCCSPWGCKESDTTERLKSTEPPTHPFVFCWGWYLRWFWPFWWVAGFAGSLLCIQVLKHLLDFFLLLSVSCQFNS